MKLYKLALVALALLANSALAAPAPDDVFQYEVTVRHQADNRVDHTQRLGLSAKLGQKGTYESMTRANTPVTSRIGDYGVISRDEVEGLAFSISPGYIDEEGGLTSIANYRVWEAGALVAEQSYTFRHTLGEDFVLPEVRGYKFIVNASR